MLSLKVLIPLFWERSRSKNGFLVVFQIKYMLELSSLPMSVSHSTIAAMVEDEGTKWKYAKSILD